VRALQHEASPVVTGTVVNRGLVTEAVGKRGLGTPDEG
jgi:hypothetical protein